MRQFLRFVAGLVVVLSVVAFVVSVLALGSNLPAAAVGTATALISVLLAGILWCLLDLATALAPAKEEETASNPDSELAKYGL